MNELAHKRAFEFDSINQFKRYLQEHPGADKSKHTVKDKVHKAKALFSSLPKKAKSFLTDPKARKKTLKDSHHAIKHFGKHAVDHFKHELKEAKSGIKKFMKGEKLTKDEKMAVATLAIEIGASAILASGALGFTGKLAASLAKHAALSTLSPWLGQAYVGSKVMDSVTNILSKVGGEDETQKFVDDICDKVSSGVIGIQDGKWKALFIEASADQKD